MHLTAISTRSPAQPQVANMCSVNLKCKYSRHTFYFKRGEEELDNLRVPQFHSTL